VTRQPAVVGAAVLAGLIVGGGAYTARHGVSDAALSSSAKARSGLERQAAPLHVRLLHWHQPRVPAPRGTAPLPSTALSASHVVAVTAQAPITRTSVIAGGEDSTGEGGDD
jgi:hypothetical protein